MRAIVVHQYGGPEQLELETDVPVPTPAENEVLIKVCAFGVNPVEEYIRTGTFAVKPDLPYTPGTDAAGVVESVGSEVTSFKTGDRVYTCQTKHGSYAEYVTAEELYVAHLDKSLSFSQGAALGVPYYTAVKALKIRAEAKPGQTVVVHGASGAVGVASVQVGKAMGLRVVGTAGTKEGMDTVKQLGADFVFNHREEGYIEAIKQAVGGADHVVEMLANVNLMKDLDLINVGGKILVVGCRGAINWEPKTTIPKEANIMGVFVWQNSPEQWKEMHRFLAEGQRAKWLEPRISKEYAMKDTWQSHHDIMNNTGSLGKLVVDTTK